MVGVVLLLAFSAGQSARAGLRFTLEEPPQRIYDAETGRQAQDDAEEYYQVRVDQVNEISVEPGNDQVVMLRGTVEEVRRSRRTRKPGDVIYIRYRTRFGTGYEDESDPIIPDEKSSLPVFLDYIGAGNHYVPAAGAFSFVPPGDIPKNTVAPSVESTAPGVGPAQRKESLPSTTEIPSDPAYWDAPVGE